MLDHFFLQVGYQVIVLVEKLAELIDFWGGLVDVTEVLFGDTEVLNQRLILGLVDFQLHDGIGQLAELDSLFQEPDPSLLECDSACSFVIDGFDFNFTSSHMWSFCYIFKIKL